MNPTSAGGRAFNFSSRGATADLPSQVRKATLLKTKPELVIVQIWATTPRATARTRRATPTTRPASRRRCKLAAGLPKARIAVGDGGTLDSYIKAVSSYGLGARLTHASKGICSIFAPKTGKVVPEHVAYVRRRSIGTTPRSRPPARP